MYHFSVFVLGKLSRYQDPVNESRMLELVQWAIDNEWSYCVTVA